MNLSGAGPEAVVPASTRSSDWHVPIEDYRSLRMRGLLASRWLGFIVVVLVIAAALSAWHLSVIADGDLVAWDRSNQRVGVASIVEIVVTLIGAAIFIAWFYRAHRNLPALGYRWVRYGNGWAIGGWFVPILALWRPKQLANDIWRGSTPERPTDEAGSELSLPAFLQAWWGLWIVSSLVSAVIFQLPVDTLDHDRAATIVLLIAYAVDIPCALLAIMLVRRVTAAQEQRARQLQAVQQGA